MKIFVLKKVFFCQSSLRLPSNMEFKTFINGLKIRVIYVVTVV